MSNSASMEGLDESGRERCASTSTTFTGVQNDTQTNDTDSHADMIQTDRTLSDLPIQDMSNKRRGTIYAEYEQPFENVVSEDEDEGNYDQEMAYLLEQVFFFMYY